MVLQFFKITLEKSVYFPGEFVNGTVFITNDLPKRIKGITLKCQGFARVQFTTTETRAVHRNGREETDTETVRHSQTEEYFSLLIPVLSAQGGDGSMSLPPGQHQFNFSFQLPHNIPSSYEGVHGTVRYFVRAILRRPWKFNYEYKFPFTVNIIADLNYIYNSRIPIQLTDTKTFGCLCCESGPLTVSLSIPKQGFIPGEQIPFYVRIENQSKKRLKGLTLQLIEDAIFFAEGKRKVSQRVILRSTKEDHLLWTSEWNSEPVVVIPSVVPTNGLDHCHLIEISYTLRFVVETGPLRMNLSFNPPITIGNVPLRNIPAPSIAAPRVVGISATPSSYQDYENPSATSDTPHETISPNGVQQAYSTNLDDLPPPTYEECVFESVNVREQGDSCHVNGGANIIAFRPQYAIFR